MPPKNIFDIYNKGMRARLTTPELNYDNSIGGLPNYSIMPDNSFTNPSNATLNNTVNNTNNINNPNTDYTQLIAGSVAKLGQGLDSISEQQARANAGREDLAPYVVGNTWLDIFNADARTDEGLQIVRDSMKDYSNVQNNQNLINAWNTNDLQNEVQASTSDGWDILSDAGTGAGIGASIGSIIPGIGTGIGTVAGAALGALSGFARSIFGDSANAERARKLNKAIERANVQQIGNFYDTAENNNKRNLRQNMMNYFAEGGDMGNGITMFNTGGSHEQNPYGGIMQGIASDGLPNQVEEGEVKYEDYIFSNRLKPSKTLIKDNLLPEKYFGLTYAELAKKLQKESEERPNDPISKQTLKDWMARLTNAQETQKAKIEERRLAKAVDNMSDEEKVALLSSLGQSMAQQEGVDLSQPMFAEGGSIHIKPSKKGTFTAAAKKRGMGVQEFASKVLAHPENYTEAMRKKAQFAHNAKSFKHAEGGHLYPDGGTTNLQFPYDVYYHEPANWKEKPSSLLPWSNSNWLPKIVSERFGDILPYVEFDRRFIDMPEYMRPDPNEAARNFVTVGSNVLTPIEISTMEEFKDESPLSLNVVDFNRDVKKLSTPIAATPAPIPIHETSPKKDARRINKTVRDLDDNATSNNEWMRYMPAVGAGIGALVAGLQPVDYSYPNELRSLASQYKPIGAPSIGGYRRYNSYDVNLGDVENLALQTAALNANKGQNRATQGALNTAVIAKSQEASAKRNIAAQQANEANRLAVDTYNLGIDQTNANLAQAYDQLNQQINNNRINMLARAAQEADSSRTAWSNMLNTTGTNFFNQLGNVGRDEWNRNQYLAWLAQHPAAAKAMGIEV